jgi:hypothetical protein
MTPAPSLKPGNWLPRAKNMSLWRTIHIQAIKLYYV